MHYSDAFLNTGPAVLLKLKNYVLRNVTDDKSLEIDICLSKYQDTNELIHKSKLSTIFKDLGLLTIHAPNETL